MIFLIGLVAATKIVAPAIIKPALSSPAPIQPLERLITVADYPAAALAAREQGTAHVYLSINSQGRVDGCTILKGTGSATLDRTTCITLQRRARFRPATKPGGEFMTGGYVHQIVWTLP